MLPEPAVWSDEDATRLRTVRAYRGHTQAQCAEALRAMGATVGQGAVSGWETKKHIPHPAAIAALRRYCDGIELPSTTANEVAPAVSEPDGRREFERLIGRITGERPLSDRQAAALDGLIKRIANGPELSEHDRWAVETMLKLLALDDPSGGSR